MGNKDLKGKKLLILGGDNLTKDIVTTAQKMGVYVIVTDWYDVSRSPAKLIADEYWTVSIEDSDTLSEKISEQHVDGILTGFTDSYLLPYQHLCEKTGLPCYGTKEQFELFISKDRYKEMCGRYGVPTIEQYEEDDENMKFPVLVKPVDSSGSRGIKICNNREELEEAISISKEASRQGKVIIERYMDCPEATVFWLFIDGEYYLTMIGNRHVKHNQKGNVIPLPVGYTFPSYLTPKYKEFVEDNAKKMFKAAGIRNGMMFMQCKVEDGMCYVYDIGYRLTGSREYNIQEKVCGYNPLAMLIHFALTGRMSNEEIADKIDAVKMKPSFNVSCLCAPGTIKDITGVDEVRCFPEVIDVAYAHMPGQTITDAMKGLLAQITVRVLGAVESKEQLWPIMQKVGETIHFIGNEGEELMLPGIEEKDIIGKVI